MNMECLLSPKLADSLYSFSTQTKLSYLITSTSILRHISNINNKILKIYGRHKLLLTQRSIIIENSSDFVSVSLTVRKRIKRIQQAIDVHQTSIEKKLYKRTRTCIQLKTTHIHLLTLRYLS